MARNELVYCAIVSESYLPKAMVLIDSIKRFEPSQAITVLLFDLEDAGAVEPIEGVTLKGWGELGLPARDYLQLATYYEAYEFATAIKPLLFLHLLDEFSGVVFIDPDVVLYSPLREVPELLAQHSCILTPHIVDPEIPHDTVGEIIMRYGTWQLGFGAFGPESRDLLAWWWERNRLHCVAEPSRGFWCDQKWMDAASILFSPRIHNLTHVGYDVAYWNIHERPLRLTSDAQIVVGDDEVPLRFYHFSGFWPANADAWAISFAERNGRPVSADTKLALRRLYAGYERDLTAATEQRKAPSGYHFSHAVDGRRITWSERRAYRAEMLDHDDPGSLPTAFLPEDSERYRRWHRSALLRRVAALGLKPVSYDLQLLVKDHKIPALKNVARRMRNAARDANPARRFMNRQVGRAAR